MNDSDQQFDQSSILKIFANYKENMVICLSIGTPKIINFPFVSNGKLILLYLPKFRRTTVGKDKDSCHTGHIRKLICVFMVRT